MPKWRFLPQARDDLFAIWDYIAQDSEDAAQAQAERIEELCAALATYPHLGRRREELAAGLRSFVVDRYIVF